MRWDKTPTPKTTKIKVTWLVISDAVSFVRLLIASEKSRESSEGPAPAILNKIDRRFKALACQRGVTIVLFAASLISALFFFLFLLGYL